MFQKLFNHTFLSTENKISHAAVEHNSLQKGKCHCRDSPLNVYEFAFWRCCEEVMGVPLTFRLTWSPRNNLKKKPKHMILTWPFNHCRENLPNFTTNWGHDIFLPSFNRKRSYDTSRWIQSDTGSFQIFAHQGHLWFASFAVYFKVMFFFLLVLQWKHSGGLHCCWVCSFSFIFVKLCLIPV